MSAAAMVFDFNGTLSDDEPVLCEIFMHLFAEHGRPMSAQEYFDWLAGLSDPWAVFGVSLAAWLLLAPTISLSAAVCFAPNTKERRCGTISACRGRKAFTRRPAGKKPTNPGSVQP